ncbi:MAG: STAS domain-containing protein, partial [Lachnospiraceae bacterium]|nr:STAS domain-containing protein [Lachnospiraceae bacterium]
MIITKTIDGNEAVLKVEGRLDTLNSPELSEEIDGLGEDISSIVMDFSELEYISSSGLRVVIIA